MENSFSEGFIKGAWLSVSKDGEGCGSRFNGRMLFLNERILFPLAREDFEERELLADVTADHGRQGSSLAI